MSQAPLLPDVPAIDEGGVLLHVGVHKTGTTAIQAALADARSDLLEHSVRYPGKLQAQHRAALALLGRPWGWNSRGGSVMDRRHFDALVRRTQKYDGRVAISSEFFCEAPEDKALETIDALGGRDRVTVVVTLRNLGKLLPSSWQQYLKYGLTTAYEKWLEDVFANPGRRRFHRPSGDATITGTFSRVGPTPLVPRTSTSSCSKTLTGVPSSTHSPRCSVYPRTCWCRGWTSRVIVR